MVKLIYLVSIDIPNKDVVDIVAEFLFQDDKLFAVICHSKKISILRSI